MATTERDVLIDIIFSVDEQEVNNSVSQINRVDESIDGVRASLEDTKKLMSEVAQASGMLATLGATTFLPAIVSAQKYVDAFKTLDTTAQKYYKTQERQRAAIASFGRISTQALLPYQELLADILEMTSKIDPDIIKAAIGIGGGLTLVGAIGLFASQVTIFLANARILIAAINANTTAQQRALAGRAALGVAAVGAGAFIGVQAVQGIGRATDNERLENYGLDDAATTFVQALVIANDTLIKFYVTLTAIQTALGNAVKDVGETFVDAAEYDAKLLEDLFLDIGDLFRKGINNVLAQFIQLGKGIDALLSTIPNTESYRESLKSGLQTLSDLLLDNETITEIEQAASKRNTDLATARQELEDSFNEIFDFRLTPEQSAALTETEQKLRDILITPLLNFLDKGEDDVKDATNVLDEALLQQLDLFDQYTKDTEQAAIEHNEEMQKLDADFMKEALQAKEDFDKQQLAAEKKHQTDLNKAKQTYDVNEQKAQKAQTAKLAGITQAFQKSERDSLAEYNDTVTATTEQYRADELKRVKDYQEEREKAEREHFERLLDAASRLDASAVFDELRGFGSSQSEAKNSFDRTTQENKKNFDKELADLSDNLQKQRQARYADYQEQLGETRLQFATEQEERKAQFEQQQKDRIEAFNAQRRAELDNYNKIATQRYNDYRQQILDAQNLYRKQAQDRQAAFNQQIDMLRQQGDYEVETRRRYYEQLNRDLTAYMGERAIQQFASQASKGLKNVKFFEQGGKTQEGLGYLHDNEFVVNAPTTRALERGLGGNLTQERLLGLLASAGGGNRGGNIYQFETNFGNIGSYPPAVIDRIVRQSIIGLFREMGQ